jgi:hypothetical protein
MSAVGRLALASRWFDEGSSMNIPARSARTLASAALLGALAGCGGGSSDAEEAFAAPERAVAANAFGAVADPRRQVLAVGTITVDQFLAWVERDYALYFPAGPQTFDLTAGGVSYRVRYYAATDNYAGVAADGGVYGYGSFTAYQLRAFGSLSDYTCIVSPGLCMSCGYYGCGGYP